MKPIVYLFGRLSGGSYTQYPDDGTSGVLGKLYPLAKAATQVIIRRDGNFMYYCYIRKLQGNSYIGMCVLLNGTYIEESHKLFSLFETRIDEMCEKGIFICYDKEGSIHPVVSHYHEESEEASFVSERIRLSFTLLLKSEKPLPPVDFSVERNSKKFFSEKDSLNDIVKSSYTFGYTCIFKQMDYDTIRMNSYRSVLNKINSENNELKVENAALQEQNKKILSQKKQYRKVVILCILIVVCGIGLFFLKDSLDITKNNLEKAQSDITQKKTTIETLNNSITDLQMSLSEEQSRREKAEADFESFKKFLNDKQPFIVKKTSFSFSTGKLSFDYYGLRNETVTLEIKAFSGDYSYSNSANMNVQKGHHSSSIYLSSSLNSSDWYSFELLIGNKIIGGGIH